MRDVKKSILENFSGEMPSDIYEVQFNGDGLRVRVSPDDDGLTVIFSDVIGFRYLDEGDLLEFWSQTGEDQSGWIFVVESGGWLDLESTREGFLSSDRKGLHEYFLATVNGCLSVLAFAAPKLAA